MRSLMLQTQDLPKKAFHFNCRSGAEVQLDMSKPQVMGILNVTPDSFSDGGQYSQLNAALQRVEDMINEGAKLIDIGGESTRPNASAVAADEEMRRVLPVIEALTKRFDVVLSVDTSSPDVMREAHALGAHIWNDVRGLTRQGAAQLAADLDVPVMLMHARGNPDTMMQQADYHNMVIDVQSELMALVQAATEAGVKQSNIILDVGFGFAKNYAQNYALLANLSRFSRMGFVQMVGMSKKRMLADALADSGLSAEVNQRIEAGLSAALIAVLQGVSIVRTHDVLATVRALSVYNAMQKHACRPAVADTTL